MARLLIVILASMGALLARPAFPQAADPAAYAYMCEDLPPANFLKDGALRGASVELLALLWKRMGVPEQPIRVVPWARGYEILKAESGRVLFSMTRTREREGLFKWVGPIFTVKHVLIGLAAKGFPIRGIDDAKKYRIGTIKDDISEISLRERGFADSSMQGVNDMAQNFGKLHQGRIDLIALSQDTFRDYVRIKGLDPGLYKSYLSISTNPNYYAFSRDSPDELIGRFMAALGSLGEEHARILETYGMGP